MKNERGYLFYYLVVAIALVVLITILQYVKYDMFGTSLLLGWDSPAYVWMAKYVLINGPMFMIDAWSYPQLYVLLLAFLGYLSRDIVTVERILPLLFYAVLIYANSEIVFKITRHVHIAGLAALLTGISVSVLRLLAGLHRNIMALSLSMLAFLLIQNVDDRKSLIDKNYFILISTLFVIAITHFETYFVLFLSLILYGFLTRTPSELLKLAFASAIPVVSLVSFFPAYFVGYLGTVVIFQRELTFDEVFLWIGGSWLLLGFLITGSWLFYKSKLRGNKLVSLVVSWSLVILFLVASIGTKIVPFPVEFASRALFLFPLPILLALAASGYNDFLERWQSKQTTSSVKKKLFVRRLSLFVIALLLLSTSMVVSFQHAGTCLTPYISRSSYEKILIVNRFFEEKSLSNPVIVFRGDPSIWYVSVYRNYIGAEIGEHYAYYGDVENLLHLIPSESKIKNDLYLSQFERYYLTFYYNELLGNISGPTAPMYIHNSHITSVEELMSHPIVIITPEFYNQEIPYSIKPFHIGDGIYVIPPNSKISLTEVSYGPEIIITRDNTTSKINSTYLYIDPQNPSIIYLSVNGASGYKSYNFTNFPSNWAFMHIEQGGDLSFPENNPTRISGKSLSGNDPTDSVKDWRLPWVEQSGSLELDASCRKEGFASLKIRGKTDSWGNLGVRYDSDGTWNLSGYSSIAIWAKSTESASFSITLWDSKGKSVAFWSIKAGESSATTSWKRFVANLSDCTSKTPGFDTSAVDYITFSIYGGSETKNMSLWIDDLTVDNFPDLEKFIYKDRVLVDETLVIYFYVSMEFNNASTVKAN